MVNAISQLAIAGKKDGIVCYGGDGTHPPKFKMVNTWHLQKTSRLRAHQKGFWLAAVYGATSLYNSTVLPSRRQLDPDLPWSLHSPRRCSLTWQTNPLPRITPICHRPTCLMESASFRAARLVPERRTCLEACFHEACVHIRELTLRTTA